MFAGREGAYVLSRQDLEESKQFLKNRMHHLFRELQLLRGERLHLLECNTPIDAGAFHGMMESLLLRKVELLERLKLGVIHPSPT